MHGDYHISSSFLSITTNIISSIRNQSTQKHPLAINQLSILIFLMISSINSTARSLGKSMILSLPNLDYRQKLNSTYKQTHLIRIWSFLMHGNQSSTNSQLLQGWQKISSLLRSQKLDQNEPSALLVIIWSTNKITCMVWQLNIIWSSNHDYSSVKILDFQWMDQFQIFNKR